MVRFGVGVRVGTRAQQEHHRFRIAVERSLGQGCLPVLVERLEVRSGLHENLEYRDRTGNRSAVNGERSLTLGIRWHSVSEQFPNARDVARAGGCHEESRRTAVWWRLNGQDFIGDP